MASLKGNIILNGVNTATSLLFPIITFPYAARVLMPEGIGAVNFLNSVISYIVLLTSLGIPMYAVKEVAKYRDDRLRRDRITIEILLLSLVLCIGGYVAVLLLARFVPQIHSQSALFYVLSLSIVFNTVGVNWFYQAIEDFRFITIRALIIRTLSAVALFIFVKTPSDLLIYGLIIVGSTVGNNIINLIHLRKIIDLKAVRLKALNLKRHVRPALQLFIFNLIVSLYLHLNSVMLGFMSGDEQVGFFTAGTKISHIGLTVLSSIGTVLLPRCSNLLANGENAEFNKVIGKSLDLILCLSLPMTFGLILLAAPVTMIFCGQEYADAIPVLVLNAPVIIFIGISNLLGIQILYPKDKIGLVIWSVSVGALVNVILNILLIPGHGGVGAAVSTLFAELSVTAFQLIYGRKYYPFALSALLNIRYIGATAIMSVPLLVLTSFAEGMALQLLIGLPVGILVYFTSLLLMKDPLLFETITSLKTTISNGRKI